MGCRCGEIARCKSDINTLNNVISKLQELGYYDGSIDKIFNYLAGCSEASVSPDNIGELLEKETGLNHLVNTARNNIVSQCMSEMSRLQNTCTFMENEDRDYHRMIEELQRRQREQANMGESK